MTCPLHPAASAYGCRHCNARARTHGKDTERSLVGRLTAMLEAERAAHERAERERDEARARVAQLEEALEWARKALDNAEEAGLLGDNADPDRTGDAAIEFDQNIAPIRAALSISPSDWLAEHDRSIAERQREACAARVRPLDADPDLSYTSAEILATPLVTK